MADDLVDYHREYGTPPRQCAYAENGDGSIRISNMENAACLSDFSDADFFVQPKKKPKLKTVWRTRDICADMPRSKKNSKLEPWRK